MTDQKKEILDLAETLLKEEEEVLIPINKLFDLIMQEKNDICEIDQLITWLKEDDKFLVIESESTQEPWSEDEESQMHEQGFHSGPRVILKEKVPSKEEMLKILQEKMQTTLNALNTVYEKKFNQMDEEEERQLIHVISKTKDLQNKIEQSVQKKSDYDQKKE